MPNLWDATRQQLSARLTEQFESARLKVWKRQTSVMSYRPTSFQRSDAPHTAKRFAAVIVAFWLCLVCLGRFFAQGTMPQYLDSPLFAPWGMASGAVQSCKVLFSPALESANDAVTVSWRCNSAWTYSMTFKEKKSPEPSGTFWTRPLGRRGFQARIKVQWSAYGRDLCLF